MATHTDPQQTPPQQHHTPGQPPRVDSPMAIRHIALEFDNTNADQSATDLVHELCPQWRDAEGPLKFVRFTDGITNTLIKATKLRPGLSQEQIDSEAILLRAYGKGTDVLIDRERELNAHNLLASRGLAPPLLARFENGLMYRFLAGDVCTAEDLRRPEVYRQVAKRLGQWHGSLPISAISSDSNLIKAQEGGKDDTSGAKLRPVPNMWTVMHSWIGALPKDSSEQASKVEMLQKELDWLEDKLGPTAGIDNVDFIFSHCDLLSGNVIIQPEPSENGTSESTRASSTKERPVNFIDYEYATPAPAAFDLSNHFAEWAGFECDHAGVPTKSQRREFLQHYVVSYRLHCIDEESTGNFEVNFHQDIDHLYHQIDVWRGVPGFYWGIWAMIQATISQIDFDYASYAETRLSEYWGWKAELDGSRIREGREMTIRERRWAEE